MRIRRPALVCLSLLLPLVAGACGDDSKQDDASATTAAKATTTTAADGGSGATESTLSTEPTTTVSPADFDASIAAFEATLAAADGDFCKTATSADQLDPGAPTTAAQVEKLYRAFAKVLTSTADALPADSGVDPAKLRAAADGVISDGEAQGWDPAKLGTGPPPSLTSAEVTTTMSGVQSLIEKNCAPPSTTEG